MTAPSCVFCERVGDRPTFVGGVLYEDPYFHATLWTANEDPAYLGQIVVQTRRHVSSFGELSIEEGIALGPLLQQLAAALHTVVHPELVYLDCYMEGVRHVHLFLTARYSGTPPSFWRLQVTDWDGAPRGDLTQVTALGERLRVALHGAPATRNGPTGPGASPHR